MSSYIIAGSADSIDTAYCEEIANRIKAKYKNIDFRFVIKHPSQWEDYLQQICRIYGFLKKSNPIIYTFDGKIIGNKQAFMSTTSKYFGLDQQLLVVDNLSNEVNMKIATEQLRKKNIIKNNIKTSIEKIQTQYQNLLKKNILKYQLKEKKQYLTHGIQYIHRQVKGLCPNMAFVKNKELNVHVEEIVPQNIDLMAISLNDQIKIDQPAHQVVVAVVGKQAFVTSNQKNASEHDRMSEASRTNKMHESIVSYDKDSKNMKQSSKSKQKLRIDEENDDVPDYIDYDIGQLRVADLSDDFHVAFQKNSHIAGQMIFYYDEQNNGQKIRMHNDNRPVKGHRVLIKEIHYDGLVENNLDLSIKEEQNNNQKIQSQQKIGNQESPQKAEKATEQVQKNKQMVQNNPFQNEKSKTQPNIPQAPEKQSLQNIQHYTDDVLSQAHSQSLNLISHLNYHTLYIQKPLSNLELKNLVYWVKDTNDIACLRFLGQNPNPRVKLYHRKYLLNTKAEDKISLMLPIQRFIEKQMQDQEYDNIQVPSQRCLDYEVILNQPKFELIGIKDIGFQHYIYLLGNDSSQETLAKVIKHTIDHILALEEQLKRDIGYNLVITKDMLMIVPLVQPYKIYNGQKLYFDGLAYLGFVHTADVIDSYQIKQPQIKTKDDEGRRIRQSLCKCSNGKILDE